MFKKAGILIAKSGLKGFTLIEVTVSIAVVTLLITSLTAVIISFQQNWQIQRKKIDLIENQRWALEFISNEFRRARSLTVTVQEGNNLNFQTSANEVNYQITNSLLQRRSRLIGGQSWESFQELANFISSNSNGNPFFSWANRILIIELTGKNNNQEYILRTRIRPRSD